MMWATRDADRNDLAEKLRQIRDVLGVSQQEVAQRLSHKLEASTISRYERERKPPLEVVIAYARLANVSMEQLVDEEEDLTIEG